MRRDRQNGQTDGWIDDAKTISHLLSRGITNYIIILIILIILIIIIIIIIIIIVKYNHVSSKLALGSS